LGLHFTEDREGCDGADLLETTDWRPEHCT